MILNLHLKIYIYFKKLYLKKLKKIDKISGSSSIIVSTNKGLMLSNECIDLNFSGILYLIIYT